MAKRIGLEGISGNSLRVGGAQSPAQRGASTTEMMLAGRWHTESLPAPYALREGLLWRPY